MAENPTTDELDDDLERENGQICASLWERLSETPYSVITDPDDDAQVMLLGDIDGLKRYVANTFAGISAILDEESMESFGYEARYSMAHYLLDRFLEHLDAAPLDAEHMGQLDGFSLVEQLHQPHFRDVIDKTQKMARALYEPPIDPAKEEDIRAAVFSRCTTALATLNEMAEGKLAGMDKPLPEPYLKRVEEINQQVADASTGLHDTINPNDLLRTAWRVMEDAFTIQHHATADEFFENCNIETEYFRQMLGFARVSPAFTQKMVQKVFHSTDEAFDQENNDLIQAAWHLVDNQRYTIVDSESGEVEERSLNSIKELNPYVNQLSASLYHMLNVQCQGVETAVREKLVAHYINAFLADTEKVVGDGPIDEQIIATLNGAELELADLEIYQQLFSKLYGSYRITSDSSDHGLHEQMTLRSGEALEIIAAKADESTTLQAIPKDRIEFLNDILVQLADAIGTEEAYEEIEIEPAITLVWNLIDEAMFADCDAPTFYDTYKMGSEWMRQELEEALERSENIQRSQDQDAQEELVLKTHFGYHGQRSRIPPDEARSISWSAMRKMNISEALRHEANFKIATEGLAPAILAFRNQTAQSTFVFNDHEAKVQHRLHPEVALGKDFDRIYRQMQKALEGQSANLDQVHHSINLANAYIDAFLQNRFRRICKTVEPQEVQGAYRQSITRELTGNPSRFEKLVAAAYDIGASRHGGMTFLKREADGKTEHYVIDSGRREDQDMADKVYGALSDAASRYGRLGKVMGAIEDNAELLFDLANDSAEPLKEMATKLPILQDLAQRLDMPPAPYTDMTSGAAIEILINALSDALNSDVSAEEMRDQYDFENTAYFDSRMKSNPTVKTRMMENAGKLSAAKNAPFVQ